METPAATGRDELLFSAAMGFLLGLVAFAAGIVRVRRWARLRSSLREGEAPGDAPLGVQLRSGFDHLVTVDSFLDILGVFFILAILLYASWRVPRVRYILAFAAVTVVGCALVWRSVSRSFARRNAS